MKSLLFSFVFCFLVLWGSWWFVGRSWKTFVVTVVLSILLVILFKYCHFKFKCSMSVKKPVDASFTIDM